MAEASTSSTGHASLAQVITELEEPSAQPAVIAPEDEESSPEEDAPSRPQSPELDNFAVLDDVEEDDSKPPFPPFNIWNIPNARVPIESYKEMTLACRFIPTDQWLTTRVDRAWTVFQVKHHMLTKIWGGRRYQLSLPQTMPPQPMRSNSNDMTARMSISSSNYSSVLFAASLGDNRSRYTLDTANNASNPSLAQTIPSELSDGGATPRLARSMSSENLRGRGRSPSSSSSHRRGLSVGGGRRPSSSRPSDSVMGDLRREEAMDHLYERMELSVKRKVLKAARNYVLVSFSNGHVLDDKDPISAYGLKPYELLEIQPASQCIRLARPTYLEPYFETDMMFRVREGSEKHGIEFLKQLRQIQKEERAKTELTNRMAALGMDENRPGSEWGTGLSAVSGRKTLEERREEEKRKIVLEQARKEDEKKAKRERREQEAEKWKYRKMIVEGHDLNIWKDHVHDTFPEQSWDLRRVVEVQIPRPQSPIEPPSATQSTYNVLALSSSLQSSVSTRAPEKGKQTKKQKEMSKMLDQPTLHIRFSIPLGSVYASLNPAAAAALHAARLKRAAKANPGSAYLAESLASLGAASTRRIDSTDPYNQGIGFGTSTLEGAGTASLVVRLPNEQTREHLCRIIHRSAGKYPLQTKHRRKLAFEPVQDLIPVPDPDPERTKAHGASFPEWRARVLKKAIASGRGGFLQSPAWSATLSAATGLYSQPPRMTSSPTSEKGKGNALTFAGHEEDGLDADEDDGGSLASDTEWEGWRRELEMDLPPKTVNPISLTGAATSIRISGILPPTQEEPAPVASTSLGIVLPENIAHTDEEARLLTPIQQRPHIVQRKSSLRLAKRIVVDGIAGKGLIMPRTNAYASWTSFSSNDSVNSSFHSHDEYHAGEGSDTTPNRKPRLAPLVTGSGLASGSGLSRAKSATVFSLSQNVAVPVASSSAPLSATVHNQDSSWHSSSSHTTSRPAAASDAESLDQLPPLDVDDSLLPGLGGGLGNSNMFPGYAGYGTTVTTVTSGRQLKKGASRSSGGSLRGVSWLSRSFGKIGEERDENTPPHVQEGRRASASVLSAASLVRTIGKQRDR